MTALGIALLMVGAIVIIIETHTPTLGILGGPGVIALAAGTVLAIDGLGGGLVAALVAAVILTIGSVAVLGLTLKHGTAVRTRRVRTGSEGFIGRMGVVRSWNEGNGRVLVDGALWNAHHSWHDDAEDAIQEGDRVVVERLNGLTLAVRKAEQWEQIT